MSKAVVFLFDVDNTLLDNDRVSADLKHFLTNQVGQERQRRYWALFEELRTELGYADYLGALQRYRTENPRDPNLLAVSEFLVEYYFANRLFPNSLDVLDHVSQWGQAAILSDGDVVFRVPGLGLGLGVGRSLRPGASGDPMSANVPGAASARTTVSDGCAWEFLTHDMARSKAYRWGEDGIAGICDRYQLLVFALALWNGRDPILKERMFGSPATRATTARTSKNTGSTSTTLPPIATCGCCTSIRRANFHTSS